MDMNEAIRNRARPPVDAEPQSDDEQAWHDLDRHARRQGWHRGGFGRHHALVGDEQYDRWTEGRATYDPTYQPATLAPFGKMPLGYHRPTLNEQLRRAMRR